MFNALTGMRQKVGNFPGVTVERLEGTFRDDAGERVTVLDLPGSYSLSAHSPDEAIALDVLLGRAAGVPRPDVIVIVVDAHNLERNLFLTSQLLELGVPTVIALNRDGRRRRSRHPDRRPGADPRARRHDHPDGRDARRRDGRAAPRDREGRGLPAPRAPLHPRPAVQACVAPLESALAASGVSAPVASLEALRLLSHVNEEDPHRYGPAVESALQTARQALIARGVNPNALEAERRYRWISGVMARTVQQPPAGAHTMSDRVDGILLHRVWGPLIFIGLMGLIFQAIFTWAQPVMTRIGLFFDWLGNVVGAVLPAGDLRSLVQDGVIGGVGSVLVFLPQIAILFLCIGILEDSGYMARAAFIMDRWMRRVGLHGRSFIPLLSGYACAVPAHHGDAHDRRTARTDSRRSWWCRS